MNPDYEQLKKEVDQLRYRLDKFEKSDRYMIEKTMQFLDGMKVQIGNTLGLRFGTASTQKVAFYGATPVVRAAAINAPSGGGSGPTDAVDISARSAINSIRIAIKNFGITL